VAASSPTPAAVLSLSTRERAGLLRLASSPGSASGME